MTFFQKPGFLRNFFLRKRFPDSKIYPNVSIDKQSNLGLYTVIFSDVEVMSSEIGDYSYVQKNSIICNSDVGRFCSIGGSVYIGLPQHQINSISTHPIFYLKNTPLPKVFSATDMFDTTKRSVIGHDVWIGQGAMIMSGVKIATGAIIGAGAICTKEIPPYAIAVGIPAKVIGFRFDENIRGALLKSEWWKFSEDWLRDNHLLFQHPEKFLAVIEKISQHSGDNELKL